MTGYSVSWCLHVESFVRQVEVFDNLVVKNVSGNVGDEASDTGDISATGSTGWSAISRKIVTEAKGRV